MLGKKAHMDATERSAGNGTARGAVEHEMSELLGELAEMSKTISAQLDQRASELRRLIQEADERIEKLRAQEDGKPAARQGDKVTRRQGDKAAKEIAEPTLWPVGHEEVFAMADAGMGAPEIARRLGRPKGEIELILALRGKG